MDKLKVSFLDFWPEIKDENIFLPILQKYFDVEVIENNPDVIIHSFFGTTHLSPQYKCKKILFIGENYRAAQYGSDYSISFDPPTDKNFRLPLWQFYLILRPELQKILFGPRIQHESFDKFCFFIVSNPNNFMRNGAFQSLNSYKRVHSYGKFMTNDLSLQQATQGRYWRDVKYEFLLKNKHKFGITYEHSPYPYYCTEKLMDAFLAGSMPIYWGDPKIKEDWNIDAFINVMRYTGWMDEIKRIDTHKEYFDQYYNRPIFTDEQKQRHLSNIENFESWLIDVIKK